jgi:proteasome accessory factor A
VTLVRAVQAGDAFMQQLARRVEQSAGGEMLFSKTNVDYASPNTWGAHESYMIQRGHDFQKGLVPFLCSRVIFGSGGFNNLSQGLEFVLSSRVPHIQRISGPDSQVCRRPIIHTRDESHGRTSDQRIHLILGEGLMGETGNLLKVATTALVVGLIEAERDPGSGVALKNPLGALRRFGADPCCEAVAKTEAGRSVRAIDIQRHYLKLAGDHLSCLPVWAKPVCALWQDVLDGLESGEEQKTLRLDWVIRRHLFTNYLRNRGLTWEALSDPDSLPNFSAIRSELFELDTKLGCVGEGGVFHMLDEQGCLRHRLQVDGIPREPAATRAVVRGAEIQKVWDKGTRDRVTADWTFLYDSQDDLELNLYNPFESSAEWRPGQKAEATSGERGWLRRLGRRR